VATVSMAGSANRVNLASPEVENLDLSALCNENVGRLNVAMNDALGVGCVERIGSWPPSFEQAVKRKGTAGKSCLQTLSLQQFHRR